MTEFDAKMRAGGGGAIVNVASVMAMRSIERLPDAAYLASKAGVIGLTRELASQRGRHGIRVSTRRRGVVTMCCGRGLGTATLIERV